MVDHNFGCKARALVVFTSWVEKGSAAAGKLDILNLLGGALQEIDLPTFFIGDWNVARTTPNLRISMVARI